MSLRAIDSLHSALEAAMRKVPRKGAKATLVLSLLSRVDWLARQCKTLAARAQCLSNARGHCTEGGEVKLCDSRCSSVVVLQGVGELVVYRRARNPIAVRVTAGSLEIATRERRVTLEGTTLRVEIETPEGVRAGRVIRLDDIDEVYENSYLVRESLKGLETLISNLLRNLAACAKATATVCP